MIKEKKNNSISVDFPFFFFCFFLKFYPEINSRVKSLIVSQLIIMNRVPQCGLRNAEKGVATESSHVSPYLKVNRGGRSDRCLRR